ncbi:MAG: nitrous oxidase accessory protein [Rhodocyclaceae bacterium]|nr:MAG: nitrous oxidase accessory protein [Rhodocyclaceae bacterium]
MIRLPQLARLGLATTLLLVLTTGNTEPQGDVPAGMGARANVDRPKPTFMLHERDKRVHGLKPFQDLIDKAPAGSLLKPPPGSYSGPVTINKPLTIDGGGQVTIDSGDRGTVMVLDASDSTIRGIHLTGSGDSHDTDDSCLDVRGNHNTIENLELDNCLFGLDLKQSNNNTIRGNSIRSKDRELGVRGDGLRLWYSNDNLIEKNQIIDSRDMVAWYSHKNVFRDNIGKRSRYSIHFMFANDNVVERNEFYDNAVGVYFMYTEGGLVRDNIISHATGATGMGIGFKEASGTIIENNEIIYCGVGIGSDLSRTTRSSTAASASAPTSRPSSPTAPSKSAATASPTTAPASCSTAKPAATT